LWWRRTATSSTTAEGSPNAHGLSLNAASELADGLAQPIFGPAALLILNKLACAGKGAAAQLFVSCALDGGVDVGIGVGVGVHGVEVLMR
jgi:hypothetical protein